MYTYIHCYVYIFFLNCPMSRGQVEVEGGELQERGVFIRAV